jgi:hypothetical protein
VVDLVQTLDGGRRNMYDPDEIEEEQREREKRNKINADFNQFVRRVQVRGLVSLALQRSTQSTVHIYISEQCGVSTAGGSRVTMTPRAMVVAGLYDGDAASCGIAGGLNASCVAVWRGKTRRDEL